MKIILQYKININLNSKKQKRILEKMWATPRCVHQICYASVIFVFYKFTILLVFWGFSIT